MSRSFCEVVGGSPVIESLTRITQSALEMRFLTGINHTLFFFPFKSKLLCHPSFTETATKDSERVVLLKKVRR